MEHSKQLFSLSIFKTQLTFLYKKTHQKQNLVEYNLQYEVYYKIYMNLIN